MIAMSTNHQALSGLCRYLEDVVQPLVFVQSEIQWQPRSRGQSFYISLVGLSSDPKS